VLAVALAGVTVLGAGCADDPSDLPLAAATPDGGAAGGDGGAGFNGVTVTVQALDNTFRPQELVIEAGTEVVFDNVGRNEHNVIPEPDSIQGWGVGEEAFAPGDVYAHVFSEPGVYAYVCTIHGVNGKGMVGVITVEAAD
jgi:plastocyanin